MRKSLLSLAIISALGSQAAFAEEAAPAAAPAAETPAYTLAYNVGLYSQYIFRGLTQTANKPAIQGGVDFTHSSGFYLGSWASNVSWLEDAKAGGPGLGYDNESLELDLYGGYRGAIKDVSYDVGLLQYVYPGTPVKGQVRAETTEVYGSLAYKWVTAKLSVVASNDTFGVAKTRGTYYADLTANYPVTDTITLTAHVGRQEYDISGTDNLSYTDWKLGLSKAFANGVTVGGYYTDTNAKAAGYGNGAYAGGNIADAQGTVFVSKTF
jgi:uncharacterized protein (TIGR02001 family)